MVTQFQGIWLKSDVVSGYLIKKWRNFRVLDWKADVILGYLLKSDAISFFEYVTKIDGNQNVRNFPKKFKGILLVQISHVKSKHSFNIFRELSRIFLFRKFFAENEQTFAWINENWLNFNILNKKYYLVKPFFCVGIHRRRGKQGWVLAPLHFDEINKNVSYTFAGSIW